MPWDLGGWGCRNGLPADLLPNWFHEFVGGTLAEVPEAVPIQLDPSGYLTGGRSGWAVLWLADLSERYVLPQRTDCKSLCSRINTILTRFTTSCSSDLRIGYAETFTSLFMDRQVIDGFLHSVARFSLFLGHAFRNYFDKPVINEFFGDGTGKVVKSSGSGLRKIQAGRVQYYMVASVVILVIFAFLYYFLKQGM